MLKIITKVKKVVVHVRTWIKLLLIILLSLVLIVGVVTYIYKPIYRVTLNGEMIGYSADKAKLQQRINDYMEKGEDDNPNIAFAQVDALPEYQMCMLKKGIVPNDDEIYEKVKQTGTIYYRYYAITDDGVEKAYVADFSQAEEVVNTLKEKKSTNKDKIAIVEKYSQELKEFEEKDKIVSKLYVEEKKAEVKVASSGKSIGGYATGSSSKKLDIGISFARPVSGSISARFGSRSSVRSAPHTGLDIAAPNGTTIKAAAAGTVTYSGRGTWQGYYVVIAHGNGVQTLYAHCSSLIAKKGQKVSKGQAIARVGSTGNSTGNHLHFEIIVNGVSQNPQNYVY